MTEEPYDIADTLRKLCERQGQRIKELEANAKTPEEQAVLDAVEAAVDADGYLGQFIEIVMDDVQADENAETAKKQEAIESAVRLWRAKR